MKKILVIQTSFAGDVILATAIVEKLMKHFPDSRIDFLLRKGNESILDRHPHIDQVLIWDKQRHKYRSLFALILQVRRHQYDLVINLQRFVSTGLLTIFSGAGRTTGFDKNPLSFLFTTRHPHEIGVTDSGQHEIVRNLQLIKDLTDAIPVGPKLYPSADDYPSGVQKPYLTLSPGSVWFTKQWPAARWIEFLDRLGTAYTVYLLGGRGERSLCNGIMEQSAHPCLVNLAGELTFLQSAALMSGAVMNYVNDSAPLHLASAVNAPVTAIFCSTIPAFGFGPLSEDSAVLETDQDLNCRPCGLHGRKKCPEGHFRCADIRVEKLLERLS